MSTNLLKRKHLQHQVKTVQKLAQEDDVNLEDSIKVR